MITANFPYFRDFVPMSTVVPKLYWGAFSQEQRIHALCVEFAKMVAYDDALADSLNDVIAVVNGIEQELPELVNDSVIAEIARLVTTGEFEVMVRQAIEDLNAMVLAATYDTYDEMVAGETVPGKLARTRGYYSAGDGGEGLYTVTSDFVPNKFGKKVGNIVFSSVSTDIQLSQWGVLPNGSDISGAYNSVVALLTPATRNNAPMDAVCLNFGSGKHIVAAPLNSVPGGAIVKGTNQPVPYQEVAKGGYEYSGGTVLLYTATSGTLMKASSKCRIEGIYFACEGSYDLVNNSDSFTSHSSVRPWEPLVDTVTHSTNGLDMSQTNQGEVASDCRVTDCSFSGFGGFGLKASHHALIDNCAFHHCHIGMYGSDAQMVSNCWFCKGGYGIVSKYVRLSNCWFDELAHHGVFSGTPISGSKASMVGDESADTLRGSIIGCVFDHIQYSAVRASSCTYRGLDIDSSFSRCGFYYAGLSISEAVAVIEGASSAADRLKALDGMCAVNIQYANNLTLRGNISSQDFRDTTNDGTYNCPQFALNAKQFACGRLEYCGSNPVSTSGTAKYQMESCYWFTKDGIDFQDSPSHYELSNTDMRYKWGTVSDGKTSHMSCMAPCEITDSATSLKMIVENDTLRIFQSITASAFPVGDTTMDALPIYNKALVFVPVMGHRQGYLGYISIPSGRNPQPVLHIVTAPTSTQYLMVDAALSPSTIESA